jgi:DNA-binding transcriptional regulator YhcF (GntR family)
MRKQLTLVIVLALTVAMIGTALTYAGGRGFRNAGRHQGSCDGPCADLTEDQRTALREKVTEMKEAGATREQIREAVGQMLTEFGVELPEDWSQRSMRGPGGFRFLCADLTEEQRATIREKVQELKESGVTREKVHEAVGVMLQDFGIELPEDWNQRPMPGPGRFRLLHADLTEEQRAAIREKVQEMRAAGNSRKEIREAVRGMFQDYGVELPEATEPSPKVSTTTAVQSASWGEIKRQFK